MEMKLWGQILYLLCVLSNCFLMWSILAQTLPALCGRMFPYNRSTIIVSVSSMLIDYISNDSVIIFLFICFCWS